MKNTNRADPASELKDGINYEGDKGPTIGVRHVQVFLIGFGIAIGFSTKSLFSIAIVAMTDNTTSSNPDIPTYNWDNKSVIISAILWSGVAVNLVAGYLGKRYGPKWFVVGASLFNSLFFTLIPVSAKYGGSIGVIICRILQGLALGSLFPLNAVVMGRWVPPEERSRLGYLGTGLLTLAITISGISTGYISQSHLGWSWTFYIFGAVGFVWTACYAYFGVQSADVHPTISQKEKIFIQTTLFETKDNEPTPFLKIISSIHVWAIIIGQTGSYWVIMIVSTEMSLYLAKVMEFDLKTNGTISSIPPLVASIFGVGVAILSDLIPKKGILSMVNSRRTFHIIGTMGISFSLIFMTYIPVEHRIWSVVLLSIGNIFIIVSGVGGAVTNILDISPKYAGIIMGFTQMTAQSISIFAPLIVQWVCTDESDVYQWRIVFIVSGAICVSAGIFFAVFASADRQNWETESDKDAEIEIRKRKSSVLSLSTGIGF